MEYHTVSFVLTMMSLWLTFLAILAIVEYFRVEEAYAPTAVFAKNGDDRSLPHQMLRRHRHFLYFKSPIIYESSNNLSTASEYHAQPPSPQRSYDSVTKFKVQRRGMPAFFVYGDSTVDVGNNNYLETVARANIAPYGRDFDTHQPTGRFSNGRLSIDYLASYMGVPYVQPFLSKPSKTAMRNGANFASAGAGILKTSGSDLGQHIPMVEQVKHVGEIQEILKKTYGPKIADATISEALHYISIGSNDFIHYYFRNVSDVEEKMTNFDFDQLLISTLMGQIEDLYEKGARKVAIVGIGPLGCVPYYLFSFNSTSGDCVDSINFMIEEFNGALRVMTQSLSLKHNGLVITFCNIFESIMPIVREPSKYGFHTSRTACCGAGRFGGWIMCLFPPMACGDADNYVWWDEFHPTDKANYLLSRDLWSGQICDPFTLQELSSSLH